MNDEIKEILFLLHNDRLTKSGKRKLEDYITNLQQENERLKEPKIFIDTQDMEERYGEELYKDYLEEQVKDYKSRIEKAVEFIKENDFTNDKNFMDTGIGNLFEVILKFLNGRSDE